MFVFIQIEQIDEMKKSVIQSLKLRPNTFDHGDFYKIIPASGLILNFNPYFYMPVKKYYITSSFLFMPMSYLFIIGKVTI